MITIDFLFLAIPFFLSSATSLYGTVPSNQRIFPISINLVTGVQTKIGNGSPAEAQAQGLSCANKDTNTMFILGYNENTSKANLVGFDVADGSIKYDIPSLPFIESAFVGIGQQIACDLTEVILVGHNNMNGTHDVIAFNPETQKIRPVVSIPGSNIGILGATSTLDTRRGILYAMFAQNKTNKVSINMFAISIREGPNMGKYEVVPTNPSIGHRFGAMKYDAKLDKVVGFGFDPKTKKREVITMDGAALGTNRKWSPIGDVLGFEMEEGAIIAIDGEESIMYAIIQPSPTGPQNYVNDTGCGCSSGAFCCRDPTQPQDHGACFTHPCSEIPTGSGGVNTTEPFRLVTIDLTKSAKVTADPPLCSIAKNDCPWQLDIL